MCSIEMLPYRQRPRMGVGTTGKCGYVRLGFERDGDRTILRDWERRAPLIVQQALYFDAAWDTLPCVYILSSGGPHLDGDRYEQHFSLGVDAYAHISTGAATKIACMQHNYASLRQTIRLASGSYLEYMPEPVIPCQGARYQSHTHIAIAETATLLYAETYFCGRRWSGEQFAYDILSVGVQAERESGQKLFADKFVVRPDVVHPSRLGIMDSFEVLSNVLVFAPEDICEKVYNLCKSFVDENIVTSVTKLPNRCGLIYRVMGLRSRDVRSCVREFCALVRKTAKGISMADEFPWR